MFKKCLSSLILLMGLLSCAAFAEEVADSGVQSYSEPEPLVITDAQKKAFQLSSSILTHYHYDKKSLDEISPDVLDDYVRSLDFNHIYFLSSDIDAFEKYRHGLEKEVSSLNLTPAVFIFKRYQDRANALNDWTLERLNSPIDLYGDGVLETAPPFIKDDDRPWLSTLDEVHEVQEKRIKDALIRLMMSGRDQEEAVTMLKKRYDSWNKRLNQTTAEDTFNIYMNTISLNFDPHSNYLSPKNTEDFDITMKLSLDGIGATLTDKEGSIRIADLIPGGPAYKSGKLKIKDEVMGVAEGKDGDFQDITGMRLDKAVRYIRGKKGTTVRLLIEPGSGVGGLKEVSLVRDTVNLEDQAAQAYIESINVGGESYKVGVIDLSSFYMDFTAANAGKKDYKSTSRDVKKLLTKLKKEKVSGIIVDLRNNGGGSLQEVINTVGLFVDGGPVVMISNGDGEVSVKKNKKHSRVYSGPLAVMINHHSASASEIFAGAIKDYKRGVIIGSNSFGKGTVQTVVDLNRFLAPLDSPPLGEVKLTIAMFHRIDGSSTQLKGVAPDIKLPSALTLDEEGERNNLHVLPWKKIAAAEYGTLDDVDLSTIKYLETKHQKRVDTEDYLKNYKTYVEKIGENSRKNKWVLNFKERQAEYKDWKKYDKDFAAQIEEAIPALKSDKKRKENMEKRNKLADTENDKEVFIPDVGLFEGLHIMADYINYLNQKMLLEENKAA